MSSKISELDENSDPAAGAPGQIFTDFSTQLHSKSTEAQIEDARYESNTNFDTKRAPKARSPHPSLPPPAGGARGQRPKFETSARPIRTDFDLQRINRSGRVDWGWPQRQIPDFRSRLAAPTKNVTCQHPKSTKIKFFPVRYDETSQLYAPSHPRGSICWGLVFTLWIFHRVWVFRAKICIFSTRNHGKIILFDFFRTFRVMAPAATPQNYKNNTKYASDLCPLTARHNYANPRTVPLCL